MPHAARSRHRFQGELRTAELFALLLWLVVALLLALPPAGADASPVTQGLMQARPACEPSCTEGGEKAARAFLDLPLDHTRVRAEVSGFVARVTVQQVFRNTTATRIEAVYKFPLPENAAVHESVLRIGDRVVRAELKEREQAKRTYDKAKKEGKKAGLLEQERPNLFTQSVANIDPGETIVTALQYVQEIHYEDGAWRFTFPMTVGPRYIPGASPSSGAGTVATVADAHRILPPYRKPETRSGHDIELEVVLRTGFPLRDLASPSHDLVLDWRSSATAVVTLDPADRLPNKDFVLAYDTVGPDLETAVLAHRTGGTGTFLLMVQPPARPAPEELVPKELVFVLDCSGSMHGQPMEASKSVMRRFIERMNPRDSFQVIRFSERASALAPAPLPNTPENRRRGLAYVESLQGTGGTRMIEGIKAALDYPVDPDRQRMVFFLTDGFIGNETQILGAIREKVGDSRLYSLGVGSSPNRYLIEGMAREGGGFAEYVGLTEDPESKVERFVRRLNRPVLTGVELDWGGLEILDPEPQVLPDLFDGQPVFLVGRYRKPGRATVLLRGRLGDRMEQIPVQVDLPAREEANESLGLLWARRRIGELMRLQHRGEIPEVRREVLELSLEHRLLTRYTAFVAVEQRLRSDVSLPLETILVPSELPEGVDYASIFGEATLSMDRVKPGDPVLAVRAPEEALAVLADFPFGLRKSLERDPETGLWLTRFLVPRDQPEGRYVIRIRVVLPRGDWFTTTAEYVVDATAPEFDLHWALEGRRIHFLAAPRTGVFDDIATTTTAFVLPDVRSVVVRPPQGGVVLLEHQRAREGGDAQWVGSYEIPSWYGPGVYTFRFYAVDAARNAFSREIRVRVPAEDL